MVLLVEISIYANCKLFVKHSEHRVAMKEVSAEPEAGIEPATYALRVRCSTTEPLGRDSSRYRLV